MSDERIMAIIGQLMSKMRDNQALQNLAKENGLSYKPVMDYDDATIENVVISMIALTLASMAKDEAYTLLTRTGIQKRSLKVEIINKYKDQAIEYFNRYKETAASI